MPALALRVEGQRLLAGFAAGLAERTAVVDIAVEGTLEDGAYERIRAGVCGLYPEQPLFGVRPSDWPEAFLTDVNGGDHDTYAAHREGGADPVQQLGNWVVAVTIGVQRWAREPVWKGRVLASGRHRLRLAIPWFREDVFPEALRLAVRLIELWARPEPDLVELQSVISGVRTGVEAGQAQGLYPSTQRFIQAAFERGVPFVVLANCIQLGWGAGMERMDSTFTSRTSFIGTYLARNKSKAARTLTSAELPVPEGQAVADFDGAARFAAAVGWPVVVKPCNLDQGVGVVPGITDTVALRQAFDAAAQLSPGDVIVERHIDGDDHRLLVVHGQLLAAARRTRGGVFGDGVHTVEQLLELANADPRRGDNLRSMLRRLRFDREALDCLAVQRVRIDSVPEPGSFVALRRTANISTGGTAADITGQVHPDNAMLAIRAARIAGLDIAGIDFLTTDVTRSWRDVGGAICEINAQPALRVHWLADPGRDINGEILDILLAGRSARIPTAVVTGSGPTTATALALQRMWTAAGSHAGVCTPELTLVGDAVVNSAHQSAAAGVAMLFLDPGVEAAVLELPPDQLPRSGHPCDRYEVAAVVGVADDEMAERVAEVLERTDRAIVLNADDPRCLALRSVATSARHVLVSRDAGSVAQHCGAGGEAVYRSRYRDGEWIMLAAGTVQTPVINVAEVADERAAMAAAALAWAQGISADLIRQTLGSLSRE